MPTKQYYATGSFKYATRMLQPGDPVQLDGPNARLFKALGKITDKKPRAAKVAPPPSPAPAAETDAPPAKPVGRRRRAAEQE